ncbi:MAG: DUF2254 family protein, partial [Acidimicrobiales bacterium]
MVDGHQLRRLRRRLREATRDNTWLVPLVGGLLGFGLAQLVGSGSSDDAGWTVTVDRSRDTLFGILGLMFTALSIVLALASVAAQNVVGRFGSRTLRLYLRRSPERWVVGSFALAAAFVLLQQFQLRKLPSDAPAPVAGLVVSIVLLVFTACLMIGYIAAVVRWFRVDQAVIALRQSALEASRALVRSHLSAGSRVPMPLRPATAFDLVAPRSGHLAEVDAELLLDRCRSLDAVAAITEPLGAAVVEGQPIGWIAARSPGAESVTDLDLAEAIDVSGTRETTTSIEYGLIGMVDIAIIALSPAVNNPNTAVEVIEEMGFLFARLPYRELGPYALGDADGCRAIAFARTFGALVELG